MYPVNYWCELAAQSGRVYLFLCFLCRVSFLLVWWLRTPPFPPLLRFTVNPAKTRVLANARQDTFGKLLHSVPGVFPMYFHLWYNRARVPLCYFCWKHLSNRSRVALRRTLWCGISTSPLSSLCTSAVCVLFFRTCRSTHRSFSVPAGN